MNRPTAPFLLATGVFRWRLPRACPPARWALLSVTRHSSFFNITGLWQGPPWTSNTTFWPGEVRITGGAYQVPSLNAPADMTGSVLLSCFGTVFYPPDWIPVPACQNLGQFGFRSIHPGGGNFSMADGSVKFVKDGINLKTYRALGTLAAGEVVSDDQY